MNHQTYIIGPCSIRLPPWYYNNKACCLDAGKSVYLLVVNYRKHNIVLISISRTETRYGNIEREAFGILHGLENLSLLFHMWSHHNHWTQIIGNYILKRCSNIIVVTTMYPTMQTTNTTYTSYISMVLSST